MLEDLTDFLDRNVALPRELPTGYPAWRALVQPHYRPTPEVLGDAIYNNAEFQALRLANWLSTPDGEFFVRAVEAVSPPFYRQDVELLVEALHIAARLQHEEGRHQAGRFALASIGAALLFAGLIALNRGTADA